MTDSDDPILEIKCPACGRRQHIRESMFHGSLKCACCGAVSGAHEFKLIQEDAA